MFVNTEEDYGLEKHERPNWINIVRQPIERLNSLYYVTRCHKDKNGILVNVSIYELYLTI